jgi:hypothetical protein
LVSTALPITVLAWLPCRSRREIAYAGSVAAAAARASLCLGLLASSILDEPP